MNRSFDSLYRQGFLRVAVAVPEVRVADPVRNTDRTIALAERAAAEGAVLTVFPELGLSSYTADDLFHQEALLEEVRAQLDRLARATADLPGLLVVGAPLRTEDRLFNCAVVVHRGVVLGVAPKSYLPNYREYYEKRQFAAARDALAAEVRVQDRAVPFGNDLLFTTDVDGFTFHVEICEDLWAPIPPSTFAAMAGATVLVNLSASNSLVGKADYRRLLGASQSARCVAATVYAGAGPGESTTDLAWDGHVMVHENGELLAESRAFAGGDGLLSADVDLRRLLQDRLRITSFTDAVHDHADHLRSLRRVACPLAVPDRTVALRRDVGRFPFVPVDRAERAERCAEVREIQVQGLASRLAATGKKRVVIGVSGGLDSAWALVVAVSTMDRLGLPRGNVLAYSMPGFATSEATRASARRLMAALGASAGEIDIRPSATQMLRDIGHPAADGRAVYDVTYENVQAGERTSHLFRLANRHGGLVVGTGDLSELALGWCTFGVGDQMAHYSVNASVPKTLVRHLVAWSIRQHALGREAESVLEEVLGTAYSPELVPGTGDGGRAPAQSSEAVVGPYELQDFHLYYLLRYGYRPSRVAYLAHQAWGDRWRGSWGDLVPADQRHEYDLPTISHWLAVLIERFFAGHQFKRSTLPNGPKVGSGGSLSPRGDWRAPSDATARLWLEELRRNVPA